jgi:hypothetical protein
MTDKATMPTTRTVLSLSLSAEDQALLADVLAEAGFSKPTQFLRSVARRQIAIGPPTNAGLQRQISALAEQLELQANAIEELRRHAAGLPPRSPTELP